MLVLCMNQDHLRTTMMDLQTQMMTHRYITIGVYFVVTFATSEHTGNIFGVSGLICHEEKLTLLYENVDSVYMFKYSRFFKIKTAFSDCI